MDPTAPTPPTASPIAPPSAPTTPPPANPGPSLKQMMAIAAKEPTSQRSQNLAAFIVSGKADEQAKQEGIDLSGVKQRISAQHQGTPTGDLLSKLIPGLATAKTMGKGLLQNIGNNAQEVSQMTPEQQQQKSSEITQSNQPPGASIPSDQEAIKRASDLMGPAADKTDQEFKQSEADRNFPLAKDVSTAVTSIPGNVKDIAVGTANAVTHPVETMKGLARLTTGGAASAMRALGVPEDMVNKFNETASSWYAPTKPEDQKAFEAIGAEPKTPEGPVNNEEQFNQVKSMISNTLKDPEKLKQAVLTHPADVALLLAGLLETRVGGMVADAAKIAKDATVEKGGQLLNDGLQTAGEMGKNVVEAVKESPSVDAVKDLATTAVDKSKNLLPGGAPTDIKDIVGGITGAKNAKDLKVATSALTQTDLKGVQTVEDLDTKMGERIKALQDAKGARLSQETKLFKPADAVTKITDGGRSIKSSWVKDAISGLQDLYTSSKRNEELLKIKNLNAEFTKKGLSLKQIDDLAVEYGKEKSAFSPATGAPPTSVTKQSFESVRKGLKDFTRSKMSDNTTEVFDKAQSDLIKTREMLIKVTEGVQNMKNKVEGRGILGELGRKAEKIINYATLGGSRGFLRSLLTESGKGAKTLDYLGLQERLPKMIKAFGEATSDDPLTQKRAIDSLLEQLTPDDANK